MYRIVLIAAGLAAIAVSSSTAIAADTKPAAAEAAPDGEVETFLTLLQAGKGAEAVTKLLRSPLWVQKAGAKESMVGQIDAAVRAYGPIMGYERISIDRVGTMAIRERYIVQHRDMVTRWEFELVRGGNGWQVGYFGFQRSPAGWFKD